MGRWNRNEKEDGMARNFLERLQTDLLVAYAPMQTVLIDWGKDMESHLSEWVLAHPDKYQDALRQSYKAGCDMGHTATQASSKFRSIPFGLESKVFEFNYQSAKLAKEVTPPDHFVVGNISASNPDFLEPYGNMTYDYVYEGYKEQILGLAEGGVDAFHISGNHIGELNVAVKVAKDHTDIPVIGSNVFYKGKKGFRTMMGQDPRTASEMVDRAGADLVCLNCGLLDYRGTTEVLRLMREGTEKYLGVMPDAGLPELIDGVTVYPLTPEEMAKEVLNWLGGGARLVGGCCGTTLKHYEAMSEAVKHWRAKRL
jgi:5-methyltetrahydrofolate--homocysteine methyltransferase